MIFQVSSFISTFGGALDLVVQPLDRRAQQIREDHTREVSSEERHENPDPSAQNVPQNDFGQRVLPKRELPLKSPEVVLVKPVAKVVFNSPAIVLGKVLLVPQTENLHSEGEDRLRKAVP